MEIKVFTIDGENCKYRVEYDFENVIINVKKMTHSRFAPARSSDEYVCDINIDEIKNIHVLRRFEIMHNLLSTLSDKKDVLGKDLVIKNITHLRMFVWNDDAKLSDSDNQKMVDMVNQCGNYLDDKSDSFRDMYNLMKKNLLKKGLK